MKPLGVYIPFCPLALIIIKTHVSIMASVHKIIDDHFAKKFLGPQYMVDLGFKEEISCIEPHLPSMGYRVLATSC